MFYRVLSTSAAVLAAAQMVSAQTYTSCNPMEKSMLPSSPPRKPVRLT